MFCFKAEFIDAKSYRLKTKVNQDSTVFYYTFAKQGHDERRMHLCMQNVNSITYRKRSSLRY